MSCSEHINIGYLARTEGESALQIEIGKEPAIELKIFEPPRFFEGFLAGRKYDEVGDIVSRICGICPISHMTTAILAIEKAAGIEVSEQTKVLRLILSVSQIVSSHLIHLYMLAMPDYYGYGGIVEMVPEFKEQIQRLMAMKEVMNDLSGLIGGRPLHPVTHMPGGFTSVPVKTEFEAILARLKPLKEHARKVVEDIAKFTVPDFHCDTEFVALNQEEDYAINDGRIVSTKGMDIPVDDYDLYFQESETPHAMAKYSVVKGRGSFMVGALARLNNKFDKLLPETKQLAVKAGIQVPDNNPFHNNLAQSIEVYDGIGRCIQLMETHTFTGEPRRIKIRAGEGGAATEAPRGILYHWYRINRKGVVEAAKLVTPTSHNFKNIEKDLTKLVSENIDAGRDKILLLSEELIRSYDPCFSCSVH